MKIYLYSWFCSVILTQLSQELTIPQMSSSYCHFHTRPYFLIQSAVVNQSSAAISVIGNCYCRRVWLACSLIRHFHESRLGVRVL